jgi:hypothetical protein
MSAKKGFRRDKPLYRLKFEADEFAGLEVTAKSLPLRELFEFQQLQIQAAEDPAAAEKIFRKLTDIIVSWNLLGDDDEPLPVSYDALAEQDMPFVMAIVEAWMGTMAGLPNHSSGSSNGGETSLELSIPMDVQ